MRSTVFVTTATSGSASIGRILDALLIPPCRRGPTKPPGPAKGRVADYEPEGRLYLIRGLSEVEGPVHDERFRYVVNFRDPRDMLCNQYHWLVQHPPGGETGEAAERIVAQRKARHALGIDASVLKVRDDKGFSFVFELDAAAKAGADVLFVSYAQLCCGFDRMVDRLTAFLGVEPGPGARAKIALESPEKLHENPGWIGQSWTGVDVSPGRHRRELKPETVAALNERWAPTLERLRALETPELRHLYG